MRTSRITPELAHTYMHTHYGQAYGLGVRTCVTHAGGTLIPLGAFGWDGAAGAFMAIDIENEITVFYAQHLRSDPNNPNRHLVYDYARDALVK
jgi:CubicO group peptidase (beta-lactamase class C family)